MIAEPMRKIAVVVPTIRDMKEFKEAWSDLLHKHNAALVVVYDGENPYVESTDTGGSYSVSEIMGEHADVIFNFNDGVRNLGFAFAKKYLKADIIISLDDDVRPYGDTIQDHIDALDGRYPLSWMNTSMTDWMRGVPYNIRNEAECWVSHGVWKGVPDYGAIEQLTQPIRDQDFYRGAFPYGVRFPFCAMNFAFKVEALPYIYQAPMGQSVRLDRFADIWGGIELKNDLDLLDKAIVTGFAYVFHNRASNVYKNLQKEARGIELNDHYGDDEYFKLFADKRARWKEFCKTI